MPPLRRPCSNGLAMERVPVRVRAEWSDDDPAGSSLVFEFAFGDPVVVLIHTTFLPAAMEGPDAGRWGELLAGSYGGILEEAFVEVCARFVGDEAERMLKDGLGSS